MHLLMSRRVLAVAAIALALAACGGDDDSASSSAGGEYGTSTTAAATASTAGGAVGTATVSVTDGHLVGPNGHTVYLFEKDQGTTSACTTGCASTWPGVTASGAPTAGSGADASLLSTADGQVPNQVVYGGHLLYEFSGDKAAGDTNGKGIPEWYLVDAKGNAIEE